MQVAGILLGAGKSERFGSPKLDAEIGGRRLIDIACAHFLDSGLAPVVFCGRDRPQDPRVLLVEGGPTMIETLRQGIAACPRTPFAFAPADMPALDPELLRQLMDAFEQCGQPYLVPVHGGRRGHPAFAREREAFLSAEVASDVWREAGPLLVHHEVGTADILYDVDTPEDLVAAASETARRARLVARGELTG